MTIILDPNPQFRGFFNINNKTGEITRTNKTPISPRVYTLRIEAADTQIPPNTGLVQVNITVQREGGGTTSKPVRPTNRPTDGTSVMEMPEERWEITDENKIVGSNLVVHGLPNAKWDFRIVGGNEEESFKVKRLNDTMVGKTYKL